KMFKVEKVNCICVDWMRGSRTGYNQAVHNIRVVGAETAFLIQGLSTKMGYSLENVHIIGHSLGAHAAGEAGRRLGGCVGRITGLDPAEPGFQGMPEEVRLDPSDAMFVDVIHTDISPTVPYLGFGMSQKVGHLDFYPNGGKQMPGCHKNILSPFFDINGLWEDYADQYQGNTSAVGQTFFLNTGASGNFARWRYRVTVTLAGKKTRSGSFRIALYGSNRNSGQYEIFSGSLKPHTKYVRDIDVDFNVGKIQKVTFLWRKHGINLIWYKLGALRVTVQSGEYGTEYNFCSRKTCET
ncbi:pancreatic lipase-related protein 2-like, partial [Myotis lucifugus]|uniref:pancreatic lipase-related protein 2-like n=1 Tax=Myotis lucifugus TaxID=59463 RepID=UPI000CCC40C4